MACLVCFQCFITDAQAGTKCVDIVFLQITRIQHLSSSDLMQRQGSHLMFVTCLILYFYESLPHYSSRVYGGDGLVPPNDLSKSKSATGTPASSPMHTPQRPLSADMSDWNPFGDDNFGTLTEDNIFGREFDRLRRGSNSSK